MSNIQIDTKEIWDCAKVIGDINTPKHNADKIHETIVNLLKKYFPNLNVATNKRDKTNAVGKYQQEKDRYALYFNLYTNEEKDIILKDKASYEDKSKIYTYEVNNGYELTVEHATRTRVNEEANVEEIVHYGWLNSHRLVEGEVDFEDTYVSETTGSVASIAGFLMQAILCISLWEEEQNGEEKTK